MGDKKMTRFLNFLTGGEQKNRALADAYSIHGDGVARMIPKELVKREGFQKHLAEIDAIEIKPAQAVSDKQELL